MAEYSSLRWSSSASSATFPWNITISQYFWWSLDFDTESGIGRSPQLSLVSRFKVWVMICNSHSFPLYDHLSETSRARGTTRGRSPWSCSMHVFWLQHCSGKETHILSLWVAFLTKGPELKISSCSCFSFLPSLADNGWSFDGVVSLLLELLTDPVTTLLWLSASFCVDMTSNFPTVGREGKRWGGSLGTVFSPLCSIGWFSFLLQLVKTGKVQTQSCMAVNLGGFYAVFL